MHQPNKRTIWKEAGIFVEAEKSICISPLYIWLAKAHLPIIGSKNHQNDKNASI